MGAVNELRLMRRSFSGDAVRGIQSRSGDDNGQGAMYFDLVAHVQSAEADIIEEEERAEQAESKRQFVRLLRLYFKKILSDQERRFLTECLRTKQTPYKVGRAMGLDYRTVIESVQRKHEANAPRLAALMRAVGYDYRRGLDFLPSFRRYCALRKFFREYLKAHPEINRNQMRKWRAIPENREKQNARRRELYNPEKSAARYRKFYYEKRKPQRQANREKVNAESRKYYAANREKKLAACRAYREVHRDEINARRRAREARKRAEQAGE